MVLQRLATAGKLWQPAAAKHSMRRPKRSGWGLLAFGVLLPMRVFATDLAFSVVEVEKPQVFQQHDGFQLATLARTPEVNVRVNRLEGRIKRHTHPTSHHFLYFIKGRVELRVGDEIKIVAAGDFVTIPRGTPHAMNRIGDLEAVFLDLATPPDIGDVIWHE
jgi:mannose-6-phosphate isomerase-like protein (cupin superfamily)